MTQEKSLDELASEMVMGHEGPLGKSFRTAGAQPQGPGGHVGNVMAAMGIEPQPDPRLPQPDVQTAVSPEAVEETIQKAGGEGYQPTGDPETDRKVSTMTTVQDFHSVDQDVDSEGDEPEDSIQRQQAMVARESAEKYVDYWRNEGEEAEEHVSQAKKSLDTKGLDALEESLEKGGVVAIGKRGGKIYGYDSQGKPIYSKPEVTGKAPELQVPKGKTPPTEESSFNVATKLLDASIEKQDSKAAQMAVNALIETAKQKGNKGKVLDELRSQLKVARKVAKTMVGRVERDKRKPPKGRPAWGYEHLNRARDIRDTIDNARAKVVEQGKSEATKKKQAQSSIRNSITYRQKKLKKEMDHIRDMFDPKADEVTKKYGRILTAGATREAIDIHEELSGLYDDLGEKGKAAEHKHMQRIASEAFTAIKNKNDPAKTRSLLKQLAGLEETRPSEAFVAEKHGQQTMFGVKTSKSLDSIRSLEDYLCKGGDTTPGESLDETSTKELKETHNDIAARLKQDPDNKALQARYDAIDGEIRKRGGHEKHTPPKHKEMDKAKKEKKPQPSETTSLTPQKARQMLHERSGGHGRAITEQQRKFFGVVGGHLPAPKTKKSMGEDDQDLSKGDAKMAGLENLNEWFQKADGGKPSFKDWLKKIARGEMQKSMSSLMKACMKCMSKNTCKAENPGECPLKKSEAGIALLEEYLEKSNGGPYIGPRGGKWADPQHTIPWDPKRHAAGKKQKQAKPHDPAMARELELTTANESQLYGQIQSIQKNLINKIANGTYDHGLASKGWQHVTDRAAKLYEKQFMGAGQKIPPADRAAAARLLSDEFFDMAVEGEFDDMLNKKNKKAMEGKTPEEIKQLATGGREAQHKEQKKNKAMYDTLKQIESGAGPGGSPAYAEAKKKGYIKKDANGNTYVTKKGKDAMLGDEFRPFRKSERSAPMSANEILEDYLEKSGGAGGLPTGPTNTLKKPKSQEVEGGSADGGTLETTPTEGMSPDMAHPGPGQTAEGQVSGVPGGKKQKLSDDDAEVEGQMKPHKKPIEKTAKSMTPQGQRDSVAHANAIAVSRLRKGEGDKQLSSDEAASELVKSDGFYEGDQSPTLDLHRDLDINSIQECGACKGTFAKSLTACPDCGYGQVGHRVAPGQTIGGDVSVQPSHQPVLRKSQPEKDIDFGAPTPRFIHRQ
jgi:hypothetical protein